MRCLIATIKCFFDYLASLTIKAHVTATFFGQPTPRILHFFFFFVIAGVLCRIYREGDEYCEWRSIGEGYNLSLFNPPAGYAVCCGARWCLIEMKYARASLFRSFDLHTTSTFD